MLTSPPLHFFIWWKSLYRVDILQPCRHLLMVLTYFHRVESQDRWFNDPPGDFRHLQMLNWAQCVKKITYEDRGRSASETWFSPRGSWDVDCMEPMLEHDLNFGLQRLCLPWLKNGYLASILETNMFECSLEVEFIAQPCLGRWLFVNLGQPSLEDLGYIKIRIGPLTRLRRTSGFHLGNSTRTLER